MTQDQPPMTADVTPGGGDRADDLDSLAYRRSELDLDAMVEWFEDKGNAPGADLALTVEAQNVRTVCEALKAAEAEVERVREGADDTPKDPAAYPTAGQWWHHLLSLSAEGRLASLDSSIQRDQMASTCFLQNHVGAIAHLNARVADLTRECDEARTENATLRAALNLAQTVADEAVGQFTYPTHPGRPCRQSGHVGVETIRGWRDALASTRALDAAPETTPAPDTPTDDEAGA